MVAGLAPLGGAVICSLACTAVQVSRFGDTFAQRYINCLAEPLRYFDKNPRDRMYIKSVLTCDGNQIQVRLALPAGRVERREFTHEGTDVTSVVLVDESSDLFGRPQLVVELRAANQQRFMSGHTELGRQINTTSDSWPLAGLQRLFDDFLAYYEIRRPSSILKHTVGPRGFDAITLQALNLESH